MAEVFVTIGGVGDVPKYTSYDIAAAAAPQERDGVTEMPVAPLAGEIKTGAAGGGPVTVTVAAPLLAIPSVTEYVKLSGPKNCFGGT